MSIACVGTWEVPNKPNRNPRWKDETWARVENEWSTQRREAYDRCEALKDQRLQAIHQIIDYHEAQIMMDIDNVHAGALSLPDSFTLRLRIPGKGLKDLALNFPYIFEIAEPDDIETPQTAARELNAIQTQLKIHPPDPTAPAVCVIDSGIQEEHILLEPGIHKATSHCFLPDISDSDVADYVSPGGHGTRVAGAVLYGETVPKSGETKLDVWVQNARVLDNDCRMPETTMPAVVSRLKMDSHPHVAALDWEFGTQSNPKLLNMEETAWPAATILRASARPASVATVIRNLCDPCFTVVQHLIAMK